MVIKLDFASNKSLLPTSPMHQLSPENEKSKDNDQCVQSLSSSSAISITKGHLADFAKIRPYESFSLKLCPSRVMYEEDYVDVLGTIIQRDFFPELKRLRLEKVMLDAQLGKTTGVNILQIQEQLQAIEKEPKYSYPSKHVKLLDGREMKLNLADLSLYSFQSLFTSEDNASFEKTVQHEKKKLALEQSWIETTALLHNENNAKTLLALKLGKRPAQLVTSHVDGRNALMFTPTDNMYGRMSIHQQKNKTSGENEIVAVCLGHGLPSQSRDVGIVCAENTRLENQREFHEELQQAAVKKQTACENETEKINLFDEMIEKGVYSAVELMREKKKVHVKKKLYQIFYQNTQKANILLLTLLC